MTSLKPSKVVSEFLKPTPGPPDFLNRWLAERGLPLISGVFQPASEGFLLVTHDERGDPILGDSTERRETGTPRYKHPNDVGNVPYCPLPESHVKWAKAKHKYLAEGHGKTLAGSHHLRLPVIGPGGNWGWHESKNADGTKPATKRPHKLIRDYISPGDRITVIPDGDWRTNEDVQLGFTQLAEALRALKATVDFVDLRGQPHEKLDDLIKHWIDNGLDPIQEFGRLPRIEYLVEWDEPVDLFEQLAAPTVKRDQLPDVIANYAFEQATLIGVDPGSIALPALATAAALLREAYAVQPLRTNPTWVERPILWAANVGEPSSKKTPAIDAGTRPASHINSQTRAAFVAAYTEWEVRKRAAPKGTFTEPPPIWIRPLTNNATMEALSALLHDNERGILVLVDELPAWFKGFGQYGQGGKSAADRAEALKGYQGGMNVYDRIGRGTGSHPVVCLEWSFSVVGGIQTERLKGEFKGLGDDGLLQRFMINSSKSRLRVERPIDMNIVDEFIKKTSALWTYSASKPGGHTFLFSAEADSIRKEFFDWADATAAVAEQNSKAFGAHVGKYQALFARLCLIFQVLTDPETLEITPDVALRVSKFLKDYQFPTLAVFYTMFEGVDFRTKASIQDDVKKIAEHLVAKKVTRLTSRWLHKQVNRWRDIEPRFRDLILDNLVHLEWLSPLPTPARDGPGRPREGCWAVNPKIHTIFAKKQSELSEAMYAISKVYRKGNGN